jgi:hypothetical protein
MAASLLLQDGRPIAFTGRAFNTAEYNYTTTEQELLAVVFCLEKWRCYLEESRAAQLDVYD